MIIHHYTSTEGLLGMLSFKKLWATQSEYLNDKSEYIYAKDVILETIRGLNDINVSKHKDIFEVCLEQIYKIYDIYTCSFSKNPDILSQWRGYCPNDGGFCIGFEVDELSKNNEGSFFECIYDYEEQKKEIAKIANVFCSNVEKITAGIKLNFTDSWEDIFKKIEIKPYSKNTTGNHLDLEKNHIFIRYELAQLSARIKNPNFIEESEFRYIYISAKNEHENIKIRSRNSLLIPYIELGFGSDAIKQVIIGPSVNKSHNSKPLELLKKQLCLDFEISESNIPFKNW
jgi:hypothetical protein